jgi:hypothetical protein
MMYLPLSYINSLYLIAERQQKDKEGQEQHNAEVLEDEMEAALT